ncbi:MAG: thioredoxin [Chitinophagaceae bacterium]
MRILTLLFSCFLLSFSMHAQIDSVDKNAPYIKNPGIPEFDLLQVDSSTHITKANITPKHKTIIMFFSPECSHCQHQTEDMIAGMDSLKDVQIVMATYQPFEQMVEFNQKYGIDKFPNIKMGRDTKYFFPPFYRMKSLPHLALYSSKGTYITSFEGNQKIATLLDAFEPVKKKSS